MPQNYSTVIKFNCFGQQRNHLVKKYRKSYYTSLIRVCSDCLLIRYWTENETVSTRTKSNCEKIWYITQIGEHFNNFDWKCEIRLGFSSSYAKKMNVNWVHTINLKYRRIFSGNFLWIMSMWSQCSCLTLLIVYLAVVVRRI